MSIGNILSSKPEVLDRLFSVSPLAVCAIEMPTFRFVAANENYSQALGTPQLPNELIGRSVFEVLRSPLPVAIQGLERAHSANEPTIFDSELSPNFGAAKTFISGALVPVQSEGDRTVSMAVLSEVSQPGLLTRIFHDLRTPLTSLKIATQFALKRRGQISSFDIESHLKLIDEKTDELTKIINSWPENLKWRKRK